MSDEHTMLVATRLPHMTMTTGIREGHREWKEKVEVRKAIGQVGG